MKLISHAFGLALAIVVVFASCSKDGPAGPAGTAGPTGTQGPAGSQGPKGDTGVANVIYSDWLDVDFKINVDSTAYIGLIESSQITKNILNTGEIKVYVNLNTPGNPIIASLPYIGGGGLLINSLFAEEEIGLSSNGNVSTYIDEGDKILQYRYLIIPGGTPSLRKANIDFSDYNKVKAYYGLKD